MVIDVFGSKDVDVFASITMVIDVFTTVSVSS